MRSLMERARPPEEVLMVRSAVFGASRTMRFERDS
jgi:hypothetical protein